MAANRPRYLLVYIAAFVTFITLGFPDGMLGIAWPSMARTFDRAIGELGLLVIAGSGGYFALTMLTGVVSGFLGFSASFIVAASLILVSAAGFALAPVWPLALVAATLGGAGGGLLDGAMNAYAATRFGTREMGWLHASYGIGATVGPMVMTPMIASAVGWRAGYGVLAAIVVVILGLIVALRRRWTDLPEKTAAEVSAQTAGGNDTPAPSTTSANGRPGFAVVVFSVTAFFFYTGAEVIAGQWSFTLFTLSRGLTEGAAGAWVAGYFAALTAGRIVYGWIPLKPIALLRLTVVVAVAGAVLLRVGGGQTVAPWMGGVGLVVLGLGLAPIFPLMVSLTPDRVGAGFVHHAVGFQIAAASVGAFTLSGGAGFLVERVGIEVVGLVTVGCMVAFALVNEAVGVFTRK